MKVIAYLRVSTAGQVRDGLGLPTQERLIKAWCKANGHRLVEVYKDEGISGANGVDTREALGPALAALRDKRAEGIVISSMDRLARVLTVQEAILGKVWQLGGKLYTVDGGEVTADDPDDPMRTAMRQMAGVFAQLDRSLVVKRLRNGRQTKAEQGGFAYGAPGYGWRAVNHELVPDDAQQAVIRRMKELRRTGASLRDIAAVLNGEGVPGKSGAKWYPKTVSRVLDREQAKAK